jgi:rubredoxin
LTEYLIRCPACELVYRPELVRPFARDKPPDEYCPQCGANLEAAARRITGKPMRGSGDDFG